MIVSLPPKRLCIIHLACNAEEPPKKPNTDHQTDRQSNEKKHQRNNHASADEKKKTRRGGNLGEGENEDERIEVVVLGRDEETQGEPQTPRRGFGFPQRLREREEKRKHGVDDPTRQKKRRGHLQNKTRVES